MGATVLAGSGAQAEGPRAAAARVHARDRPGEGGEVDPQQPHRRRLSVRYIML